MPTKKQVTSSKITQNRADQIVRVSKQPEKSLLEKLQLDLQQNQSYLNLILGSLIIVVLGVLVFNYFNKPVGNIGPAQQTDNQTTKTEENATKESLPGKYTVKEGDTLYLIAQKYYSNGFEFPRIAEVNKLADVNLIEVGQVLEIPVANTQVASITLSNSESASSAGQGGATNQTIWGEKISSDTYTVAEGDWLSKIAGRAYGDVMTFDKIAKANNITDPNLIEPGTVLKIPR